MNRTFWIDLIRVAGAFFVVLLHTSYRFAGGPMVEEAGNAYGSLGWLVTMFFLKFACVAVPLFLMVSGALLLGRNEEMLTFYRKRFGKILLPFFAWSCIFVFCLWIAGRSFQDGTPITLFSSIGAFLSGGISGHFWFMYMLISLYLVAPFLAVFARNASKNMLIGFLMLWFFAAFIFPVLNAIAKETLDISDLANFFPFESGTVSYSVGFFVTGYVLKDIVISKRWLLFAFVAWFLLALTPINSYLQMTYPDSSVSFIFVFLKNYVFPIISNPMTLAVIAFFCLRSIGDLPSVSSSRFGRAISTLAPLTFGIFLCHHLFLVPSTQILDKLIKIGSAESWLFVLCAVPTLAVLIYFAAAVLIYVIRCNRYLKSLFAP